MRWVGYLYEASVLSKTEKKAGKRLIDCIFRSTMFELEYIVLIGFYLCLI